MSEEKEKKENSKMKQRSRGWCFTIFNYEEEYDNIIRKLNKNSTYYIIGKEICPTTGNKHLQGYAYYKNAITGKSMLSKLTPTASIERANGTAQQNYDYCSKEMDFIEHGEMPKQGERVDLITLANQIKEGKKKVNDLAMENPYTYHCYGRTLEKIENITINKNFRKHMTKGIWLYGPTGVGKSHIAFNNFGEYDESTHYTHPSNDGKWWDGYTGQKIVIINDFRANIPFSDLLQLVDKWPYKVPRRFVGPIQFTSEIVIITSSMHPRNAYNNIAQTDDIGQLYRRFDIYLCEDDKITEQQTEEREKEKTFTQNHFDIIETIPLHGAPPPKQ